MSRMRRWIGGAVTVLAVAPQCQPKEQEAEPESVGSVSQALESSPTVVLQANRGDRFVTLNGNTLSWVNGTQNQAYAARFLQEAAPGGFKLKSVSSGQYVKVASGSFTLLVSEATASTATLFQTEPCGDQVALMADKNGDGAVNTSDTNRYVKANDTVDAKNATCVASSTTSWEKWQVLEVPPALPNDCVENLLSVGSAAASSQESASFSASKAIDQNASTRWSSAFSDPQWISVDLGAQRYVSRVVLDWQNSSSKDYDVQISSTGASNSWETVVSYTHPGSSGARSDNLTGLGAAGRYLRVYSRQRTTQYGNSLYEIRVYGDTDATCAMDLDCDPASLSLIRTADSGGWTQVQLATDGNPATKTATPNAQAWIEYDLGGQYTLSSARLNEDNAGAYNVEEWKLSTWNGTAFVDAFPLSATPTGSWNSVSFAPVTTSKVRFHLVDGSHVEVGEVEVTGAPASGCDACANVTCTALSQCHEVGTCNPTTGTCSNPTVTDGTVCDDEDTETSSDACNAGTCAGVALCANVTCTALDQCHGVGACDPQTGLCDDPDLPDGTACDDSDANTTSDECVLGTCAGVDLCENVTCSAQDQCHVAGACDHLTGICSNPTVSDGTTCNDGNAATTSDVCTAGACAGVDLCAGVTCVAQDQCHVAGMCDHLTGVCSNPAASDGTTCNDGNAATTSDVCTAGTCAGVDLCAGVTCVAQDQCHVAGTCDHLTGVCSNPAVSDGTTCSDGNATTTSDVCTEGVCAGVDLCAGITCSAQDQCHVAGTCDHLTGVCSNPAATDGTTCNDGNAATASDVCTAGTCAGVDLCAGITCSAQDQCHVAGTCDHLTGVCSNPAVSDGTTCNDDNAITTSDQCTAGVCAGVDLCAGVACTAQDQCHVAGTCDHLTGVCSNPAVSDGTTCNDGNATTTSDQCTAGVCAGVDLCAGVTCTAQDQCHVAGTCDHLTGVCSNPTVDDGTTCNDGNAATTSDQCTAGTCAGVDLCATVNCYALDDCHAEGTCDPNTGVCSDPELPDETACDDGDPNTALDECTVGVCVGVNLCADVTCTAADNCHGVGSCDPQTGECSSPELPDGTSCNDGNSATTSDECDAGVCAGIDLCAGVVCTPPSQCHTVSCVPETGECGAAVFATGAACEDGNECTQAECRDGGCVTTGTRVDSIRTNPLDACEVEACDPVTGSWQSAGLNIGAECGADGTCDSQGTCIPNNPVSFAPTSLPPLPDALNPANADPTEPLDFEAHAATYYTGPEAHQHPLLDEVTGQEIPIVIAPHQVALVAGAVRNSAGGPLPGVTVKVKGRPEFGYVLTDANGRYDIALGGGGALMVEMSLPGYLPADRLVDPGWHEGGRGPDAILLPLPSGDELVDVSDASGFDILASGPESTEPSNPSGPLPRTPRLFIPQGTEVQPYNASAAPIQKIGFREYTDLGPAGMPAPLPPTSKYTYAISLTAHDAQGNDLGGIRFTKNGQSIEVPFYVDNFLSFPVGAYVPLGYYDRELGSWLAEKTGTILKVLPPGAGGEFRLTESCQAEDFELEAPWSVATAGHSLTLDVNTQTTNPFAFAFSANGTKLYVFGQTQRRIFQYALATPWDISTATHENRSVLLSTQFGTGTGLQISANGTRIFALSATTSSVYQYNLSSAGNVDTAVQAAVYNLATAPGMPSAVTYYGLAFSEDGTTMVTGNSSTRRGYQLQLSTPWSIATATHTGTSFSYATQTSNVTDWAFGAAGTRLMALGTTAVRGYDLSTPYDISTAIFDGNAFSITEITGTRGLSFSQDGSRFFITSAGNGTINQYDVACAELSSARYEELGITVEELEALSQVYTEGDEVWRMQLAHLSPHDPNPGPPAPDCNPTVSSCPGDTGGEPEPGDDSPEDDDPQCGSIINTQSQNLSETISLAGTPYTLMYHSQRAQGFKVDRTIRVPVDPTDKPFSSDYVTTELSLQVGAQVQVTTATTPVVDMTWEGPLGNGPQQATLTLHQRWNAGYSNPPVFAGVTPSGAGRGLFNAAFLQRTQALLDPDRLTFTYSMIFRTSVGGWRTPVEEFGGWGLNVQHAYQNDVGVLFRGDGREDRTSAEWWIENDAAAIDFDFGPDGSMYVLRFGPGGPIQVYRRGPRDTAFTSYINLGTIARPPGVNSLSPRRIRVDSLGRVYILGDYGVVGGTSPIRAVLRVTPTNAQIVTNFTGFSPAPYGIAFDITREGQFVVLAQDCRVFRVSPDGQTTQESFFTGPTPLTCSDIKAGADGSIYRSDRYLSQRLFPDGTLRNLTTPCVTSQQNCGSLASQSPDGLPLASLIMDIRAIHPTDSGEFFIVAAAPRVFRVDVDGIVHNVTGTGTCQDIPSGAHMAADTPLSCQVSNLQASPNGDLYALRINGSTNTIAHLYPKGVRNAVSTDQCFQLNQTYAPGSLGAYWVTSEDGRETYCFTKAGRHLGTFDATTGVEQLQFNYAPAAPRLLTQVRSRRDCPPGPLANCPDTSTLRIDRSNPSQIALLAPGDHPTVITLDGQYASTFTVPAGRAGAQTETIDVTHDPNTGFLTAMSQGPQYGSHHYEYDDLGRLLKDTDPNGGEQHLTRINTSLDEYEVQHIRNNGLVTRYRVSKDDDGETKETTAPSGAVTTTFTSAGGDTVEVTSSDATVTTTTTTRPPNDDLAYEETTVTSAPAISATPLTTFTERTRVPGGVLTTTTTNGATSSVLYDDGTPGGTPTRVTTSAQGRTLTETLDAEGRVLTSQWSGANAPLPVINEYDTCAPGKLCKTRQGTREQLFQYTGGHLSRITANTTDASGSNPVQESVVEFQNDGYGRALTTTLEPGTADQIVTSTEWDIFSNLSKVIPPGKPEHVMTSNGIGLEESYFAPYIDDNYGTGVTFTTYDAARRLETVTHSDGTVLAYSYDPSGQLLSKAFGLYSVDYDYYPCNSNPRCGKLRTVMSPYGGYSSLYNYGNFLVTSRVDSDPAFSKTVTFGYDSRFRRRTVGITGVPNPETLTYNNDSDSDITCLSAGACSAGNARITYTLDPSVSRVSTATTHAPTGQTLGEAYTYNAYGQVETYNVAGGATPFALGYTYDALGRIETVSEMSAGATQPTKRYEYDAAGRLWKAYPDESNLSVFEEYTYDQNGNRDCAEGAAAYDAQDRIKACNGVTYTFDDNGSLVSRGADVFEYDVLGNLLSATVNGTTVDYLVDGENRRVGRTVNGVTTRYVYSDQLRIIAELDGAGNVISHFYYADGVNVPEFMVRGGVTYKVITDHLGSVRQVVNEATGAVVFAATYGAWGNRTVTVGSESFVPFGFAGGLHDVTTGLVRFGARDYDAEVGRWAAKDPVSFDGGQSSLYSYSKNDSVNKRDPYGLGSVRRCAAAIAEYLYYKKKLNDRIREQAEGECQDRGHEKAIEQLSNRVEEAELKVIKYCGPEEALKLGLGSAVLGLVASAVGAVGAAAGGFLVLAGGS